MNGNPTSSNLDQTRADLTRWNRAGLQRFRYVDGNAATFLEILRERLGDSFPGYLATPTPAGETPEQRNRRLAAAYQQESSEWGWLLARELARGTHVLGEYLDAYANEGFLPTATQWDHLRRLVELIDYHPAPPASASTPVALALKANQRALIKAGLALSFTPPDGAAPVIFETLEDLDADAALNLLRPAHWDRNPRKLRGHELVLAGTHSNLKSGQPLVLENELDGALQAYAITGARTLSADTVLTVVPRLSRRFQAGWTKVHLQPADVLEVKGPLATELTLPVLHFTEPPAGLVPKEIIWIAGGGEGCFARVRSVAGKCVTIDARHTAGHPVSLPATAGRPLMLPISGRVARQIETPPGSFYIVRTPGDWARLQGTLAAHVTRRGELQAINILAARYHPVAGNKADPLEGYTVLTLHGSSSKTWLDNPQSLLVQPEGSLAWTLDQYLGRRGPAPTSGPVRQFQPDPRLETARPKQAAAGDLAVLGHGRQWAWGRLTSASLDAEANQGILEVARWQGRGGGPFFRTDTRLYSRFTKQARVVGWILNPVPLQGLRVPLAAVPAGLKPGRRLLAGLEGSDTCLATRCLAVEGKTLILAHQLPAGATYGKVIIRANVVLAGHGETRDAKTLGSGNAQLAAQEFIVPDSPVAFVADPTMPAGVRPAIEILLDGRLWQERASFANSGPADAGYVTRITEDGKVRVLFGDGRRGRRLPTGQNNVRVRCRVGNGPDGNLAPGCLKLKQPHPVIVGVEQCLPAVGGAGQEAVASLRENAPRSLLALERAVSLEDFAALAASQSSIAQAIALTTPTGLRRSQRVEVVIAPAHAVVARGMPVVLGTLGETVCQFLLAHAPPGIEVVVSPFVPVRLALRITIWVDMAAFEPEGVKVAVRTALARRFALDQRKLGEAFEMSAVYAVVEAVPGVENSRCEIIADAEVQAAVAGGARAHVGPDGLLQDLQPVDRQAVYIASASDLQVVHERFNL